MTADTKKRGLGRGLDALFQDVRREEESFAPKIKRADEIAIETKSLPTQAGAHPPGSNLQRRLPVDKLTPGKFQPRRQFDEDALDNLAESIGIHGVLQPLLVRPLNNNMYEIIAGERRWRAAQKAQVHEVPVVIRDLTDQETLEVALIENLQREDLTSIEEAEGYQRLMDEFGHTQDVLAKQVGKSRSHIANTLRLLKLPSFVQQMVQQGYLSAGHARALIGAKNAEDLAERIVSKSMSVRQAEALVQKSAEGKAPGRRKVVQKDVDVLALEELTSNKLGMNVTIDSFGEAGVLTIEYASLDQLDDLLARLGQVPRQK